MGYVSLCPMARAVTNNILIFGTVLKNKLVSVNIDEKN